MKKTLLLLLSMLLASLYLCADSSAASVDDDGTFPVNRPPNKSSAVATVYTSIDQLEVLFLDEADNAVVEIYDESGTSVYRINGKVDYYDRLKVDACQWQGSYTVQVTLKGRSQTFVLNL